ncbi:DEAD/DEAH box helicase [Pseudofrankia sp. DC12]|uniref:DEAD/DEAH box helicase n=1 Tax=Pseudofrankia sp. DC12 TaxID=683315 RepID=UPI000A64FA54|nr:DEAD/DEAH box helicase [Pseudofrankia sp. DC12]
MAFRLPLRTAPTRQDAGQRPDSAVPTPPDDDPSAGGPAPADAPGPVPPGSAEARRLLDDAAALRVLADEALAQEEDARAEVARRFQAVRASLARRDLATMDVERLKDTASDRLPFPALRRAGYRTVADLVDERPEALATHPGVGGLSATRAIGAARALEAAARERLGLRVALDPSDERATDLLRWLRRVVALADALDDVRGPAGVLANGLPPLLAAAAPARGWTRMLLAGERRRVAARQALDRVQRLLADATAGGIAERLTAADRLASSAPGDTGVWGGFERAAVRYYGLLGEIVGIRDTADAAAGQLPEDIAARVREQRLDGEFRTVSLRGYQAFGAKFALAQRRVILGDEMGLGKTVQAIAALAHLRALDQTHFLVVCPTSVLVNWLRETARHSTLTAHRLHGPDRADAVRRWVAEGGVGVTTFDTLAALALPTALRSRVEVPTQRDRVRRRRTVAAGPAGPRIAMLVADEAHYVKNPATKRAEALRALVNRADLVDRVLFLTGTPMENRVEEFRRLVGYLQPSLLPVNPATRRPRDAPELSPARFRTLVAPVYLRRNTQDVLSELPERVATDEWVELGSRAEQAAYRKAVLDRQFMAMRRVAFTGDPEHSAKLDRLVDIAREAAENAQRVVVFSFFLDVLDVVGRRLRADPGCGAVFGPITGSVPAEERQQLVDDFGAQPAPAVLLSQIAAGGTGLNMQAASVVILCEPQVKPTLEEQAIARLHRMGQIRTVQVHRLLTTDSVDQRLVEILAAKRVEFDAYARRSDLADAGPEALDVSDEVLTKQVLEEEYARIAKTGARA